jgi:hypothetical protein
VDDRGRPASVPAAHAEEDILVTLFVLPCDFDEACEFVRQFHRHHRPPVGHKFSLAATDGEKIVGVSIVGRPVARFLDDGQTLEVTRLATDGTKNACSFLYAASWRATRALGYQKLITYILDTEPGISLTAAGWKLVAQTQGGSWSCKSRPRVDKHPLQGKLRWEISAN